MNPGWAMVFGYWLETSNGPRFGEVGIILVGKYDDKVLRQSDGGLVGQSETFFHSDHQRYPVSGDV